MLCLTTILLTKRKDWKKKSYELIHPQDQITCGHNSNEFHSSIHHVDSWVFLENAHNHWNLLFCINDLSDKISCLLQPTPQSEQTSITVFSLSSCTKTRGNSSAPYSVSCSERMAREYVWSSEYLTYSAEVMLKMSEAQTLTSSYSVVFKGLCWSGLWGLQKKDETTRERRRFHSM